MQLSKPKLLSAQTIEFVLVVILIIGGIAGFIVLIDGQQKAVREITRIQSNPATIKDMIAPAPVWTGSSIELDGMRYLVALESLSPSHTLALSFLIPDTERNREALAYLMQNNDSDSYKQYLTYGGVDGLSLGDDADFIWLITNTETKKIIYQSKVSEFAPYTERGVTFSRWRDDRTLIFSTGEGDSAWSSEGFVLFDISKNAIIGGLNRYCASGDCTFKQVGVETRPSLMFTADSATLLTRERVEIALPALVFDYDYPLDAENNLYYSDQGIELRDPATQKPFFVRWDVGIAEIRSINVAGANYLVAQEIVSSEGRIARMLTTDTAENREHLKRILDLGYHVSNTWFPLELTIWNKQGELVIHEVPSSLPALLLDAANISLERWDDKKTLVFVSALGDAGISAGQTYLYNPDTRIITPALGYFMDGGIFNGQATSFSYFYASNEGKHLVQFVDAKTDQYTPVYWLTREEIGQLRSLDDLKGHLSMFNIDVPMSVDIASETNTRRYKEGIELYIDGEKRFVYWNTIVEVDGPTIPY